MTERVLLRSGVLLLLALVPAQAQDQALADQLKAAQEAYTAALGEAQKTFLASFDKDAELIRQSTKSVEEKRRLIDQILQEKSDYQVHGWYPWSARARPALVPFLRERHAAEKALITAFDKVTDAHIRKKDDAAAASVAKLKKETLAPKVIARWEMTGVNWKGTWTAVLYSNGHYSDPDGRAVWTHDRNTLTLVQPEAGAPGGRKILRWTVRDNGRELDEVGNNGARSAGRLVNLAEKAN